MKKRYPLRSPGGGSEASVFASAQIIDEVLRRLQGVRRTARGWIAKCPAHSDENPSLTLSIGQDGRILLFCHAGCRLEDVCAALGIRVRDLFPGPRPTRRTSQEAIRLAVEQELGRRFEAACNDVHQRLAFALRFVNRQLLDGGFEAYLELAPLVHELPWLEHVMDSLFDRDAETRVWALREGLRLCRELAL